MPVVRSLALVGGLLIYRGTLPCTNPVDIGFCHVNNGTPMYTTDVHTTNVARRCEV
jgi:hypothetical protein